MLEILGPPLLFPQAARTHSVRKELPDLMSRPHELKAGLWGVTGYLKANGKSLHAWSPPQTSSHTWNSEDKTNSAGFISQKDTLSLGWSFSFETLRNSSWKKKGSNDKGFTETGLLSAPKSGSLFGRAKNTKRERALKYRKAGFFCGI